MVITNLIIAQFCFVFLSNESIYSCGFFTSETPWARLLDGCKRPSIARFFRFVGFLPRFAMMLMSSLTNTDVLHKEINLSIVHHIHAVSNVKLAHKLLTTTKCP